MTDRQTWAFDEITDPFELWSAIDIYRDKLGIFPGFPQGDAREVLTASWGAKYPRVLTDDPREYWKPFIDKNENEFIWLREPDKAERKAKFAHAFDKRKMFLSAARGAMFGPGEYFPIGETSFTKMGNMVGLVQVKKLKFSNALKPEFAKFLAKLFNGSEFYFTPYLHFLKDYADIQIKRGWVWPEPYRIFEKFAKQIGDAIADTRRDDPESLHCNRAFKDLYVRLIGWFARGCECQYCFPERPQAMRCKLRETFPELYRPDWRGIILAQAGADLLRNIENVYKFTGTLPFGINHDCLMYFSEEENWEFEFSKSTVSDPNKYTHEWTAPGEKVRAAIDGGLNAMQLEKAVQNA